MPTLNIGFGVGPLQIQAARGLFAIQSIGSGFVSTGGPPPVQGAISWAPGLWGLTYQNPWTSGTYPSDLSLLAAAGSAWKGYMVYATWDQFENATQGTYTWTLMDATIAACAAKNLQFMLQLNLGTFNKIPPTQGNLPRGVGSDLLPEYLVKGSTFGSALMGSSGLTPVSPALYGYYVGGPSSGCYWANFTNANVMARIQALANAMGTRYNGNPNFYGVILCAWDVQSPNSGTGITDAQYFGTQSTPASQGRELILSYFKTAMPNCNVCEMTGYAGPGGSVTVPQQHAQWCVQNAIPLSCSDTAPATAWNANYESIAGFTANGNSFASIGGGGTTGTLNGTTWQTPSGAYLLEFTSTSQIVTCTLVNGASTCTFSPAVTGSPTLTAVKMALMPTRLNVGMYSWFGMTYNGSSWTPPTPGLQTYCSFFATVEAGDFSNAGGNGIWSSSTNAGAAADILNAGNEYYDASHVFMSILYNGDYTLPASNGASFANIYSSLNAIGVTNTAYPSVYPSLIPSPPNTYNALTNTNIYAEPAVPSFGPANSIITDSIFSNRILRVTDGNTYSGLLNYSWRPNDGSAEARRWNATSTRFCVTTNGNEAIFDFNSSTFQAASHPVGGSFFINQASGTNGIGTGSTGQWDAVSPDIFWGVDNSNNVSSYNIATSVYTSVWATSGLPGGSTPGDLSVCLGNGLITIRLGPQDTATSCAAYLPSTSTQYLLNCTTGVMNGSPIQMYSAGSPVSWIPFELHNVRCGNDGRYIVLTAESGLPSSVAIWDIVGNIVSVIPQMQGHQVSSYGWLVNTSATSPYADQAVIRGLTSQSAITTPTNLNNVPSSDGSTGDTDRYYSWSNGISSRLVPIIKCGLDDTNTGDSAIAAPWQREVVALSTNGSGLTYRMCHHFSWFKNFEDGVHATVSPNGLYAMFASNWATTLGTPDGSQGGSPGTYREDCFIVEMKGNG